MQPLFVELPLSAQTAYAQLLEASLGAEHVRSVADLSGSFNAKKVKGRKYWYFQYTEPSGKLHQVYVGPDTAAVHRLMERKADPGASAALAPLARAALALGCAAVLPRHYRVLRRLADYGFFQAGGLLIRTHAFLAYGNMLGVRWGGSDRTQDIDFAHAGKAVSLLLPGTIEARTDDAITSLGMGFLPVAGLGGKTGGAWLIPNEPEFRLDFLTPRHRGTDKPFVHPQLGVTLQPLPFMEYSLQGVEQAVLPSAEGAVLVNLPDPARYALHKVLIAGEREGAFRVKARKDLAQAAHLLAALWQWRRESLAEALDDLLSRGRGWQSRFRRGARALLEGWPELEAAPMLVAHGASEA
ncbi:MAG: nucleotidyltransferase domain-containing protein [Burkholderiales bacterium]|nr:nucleotidyltransferase domain-containing protein [Burkholderiales bacterium]OJX08769.1 MAG: hypothetical protein BGO72_16205 [Burkholderiales bacterium 70-64]